MLVLFQITMGVLMGAAAFHLLVWRKDREQRAACAVRHDGRVVNWRDDR